MILPIIFTIYIGLPNLSTGHYLSQDYVRDGFLSEVVVAETALELDYSIYEKEEKVHDLCPT